MTKKLYVTKNVRTMLVDAFVAENDLGREMGTAKEYAKVAVKATKAVERIIRHDEKVEAKRSEREESITAAAKRDAARLAARGALADLVRSWDVKVEDRLMPEIGAEVPFFDLVKFNEVKEKFDETGRVRSEEFQNRACLANAFEGTRGRYDRVHIPSKDWTGMDLSATKIANSVWATLHDAGTGDMKYVPIVTMSGMKGNTFHRLSVEDFNAWVDEGVQHFGWDRATDGFKVFAYMGLAFSEVNSEKVEFDQTVTDHVKGRNGNTVGRKAAHGGVVPDAWWQGEKSGQVRGGAGIRFMCSFLKGVVLTLQGKNGSDIPVVDDEQVKLGGNVGDRRHWVLAATDTDSRLSRKWLGVEPLLTLEDNEIVRKFLAERTHKEVSTLLNMDRGQQVARLGGLRLDADGNIVRDFDRAVLEMMRSKTPDCSEMETRKEHYLVREMVVISKSGGIRCSMSMIIMDSEKGAHEVPGVQEASKAYYDAKKTGNADAIKAAGEGLTAILTKVKCIVKRDPDSGPTSTVYLDKVPYIDGVGCVLDENVTDKLNGDADGDHGKWVTEMDVISLFAFNTNWGLKCGMKPKKDRRIAPISAQLMEDELVEQLKNAWQVGALTTAAWKAAQQGWFDLSADLNWLAVVQPMTMKHHIIVDGKTFGALVEIKYNRAVKNALKAVTLEWKVMETKAESWKTIRAFETAEITDVKSHIDTAWNAMVAEVKLWTKAHPQAGLGHNPFRVTLVKRGIEPTAQDWISFNTMYEEWRQYWADNFSGGMTIDANGKSIEMKRRRIVGEHKAIYAKCRDWAKNATVGALAACLLWEPRQSGEIGHSDGFGIKFHTVFSAGRGVEVLGLHPDVERLLDAKRSWWQKELLAKGSSPVLEPVIK